MNLPKFTARFVEQVLIAAVAGFAGDMVTSGYDFSQAGIAAAVAAGIRAVYGVVVKPVGDIQAPNMVK